MIIRIYTKLMLCFMVTVLNGQNVGIGTSTPLNKLDVDGDITVRGGTVSIWPDNPSSQEGGQINLSKHGTLSNGPVGTWALDVFQNDFRILNNDVASPASEFLRVKENGNVGIATLNPGAKLDVAGDIAILEPFKFKIKNAADNENYLRYETTLDGVKLNGRDAVFITTSDPTNPTNGQDLVVRNGRVGINTNTPSLGLLHVNGFYSTNVGNFHYYALNGNGGPCCSGSVDVSIWASNRVLANEFNAYSDSRIKQIKGFSNSERDLEILNSIRITDYTLKDNIINNRVFKKLIAQQLEEVYPQSVSKTIGFIPDIYKLVKVENGLASIKNDLKKGDIIKLILPNSEETLTVLEATADNFRIDSKYNSEIFIFGKQVDDFRVVDYEAVSMLNVSATQELSKRMVELKSENERLRKIVEDSHQLNVKLVSGMKELQRQFSELETNVNIPKN